jgi:hypothetical protein
MMMCDCLLQVSFDMVLSPRRCVVPTQVSELVLRCYTVFNNSSTRNGRMGIKIAESERLSHFNCS